MKLEKELKTLFFWGESQGVATFFPFLKCPSVIINNKKQREHLSYFFFFFKLLIIKERKMNVEKGFSLFFSLSDDEIHAL